MLKLLKLFEGRSWKCRRPSGRMLGEEGQAVVDFLAQVSRASKREISNETGVRFDRLKRLMDNLVSCGWVEKIPMPHPDPVQWRLIKSEDEVHDDLTAHPNYPEDDLDEPDPDELKRLKDKFFD